MTLRNYQARAIEALRDALRNGNLRNVLYLPTGGGKTRVAQALIESATSRGKRVAFVVNRVELVKQASRHFFAAGIRHGVIQADNTFGINELLVVCSIQTVARRGLPPVDFMIIDEAHACPGAKEYRRLIFTHSALPVIGLTATPFARGMGQAHIELGGEPLFQRIVVAATIRELIDEGYLVDCDIFAPSEPDLSKVRMTRNANGEADFNEVELGHAVDKPDLIGDIVTHWLHVANQAPTVCFATNIAHSRHIVQQFQAAGVAAEHIDCYTDEAEREAIMARVSRGDTKVISNVGILTEGWDFPACSVMILARPTASLTRWIQMAGRILRPYPGKLRGIILDHSGSTHRLGYPTDDLPLALDDGAARKTSNQEPRKPAPKACPSCAYMKPIGVHVCPKCSFAPERQDEVEVTAGTLTKLERNAVKATREAKQNVYGQLIAIANARGYQRGWVANQYRKYFGVWPTGLTDSAIEPTPELTNWVKGQLIRYAKGKEAHRAAA